MLPPPERLGGQRRYSDDVLHRLAFIRAAQLVGFTLDQIRPLTGANLDDPDARARLRVAAHELQLQLDDLIRRTLSVRHRLERSAFEIPDSSSGYAGPRTTHVRTNELGA